MSARKFISDQNKKFKESFMKKIFLTIAALAAIFFGFTSCASNDDDNDSSSSVSSESSANASTDSSEKPSGTFWGSLTVYGASYDCALEVTETSVNLYSTMMSYFYTNNVWQENDSGSYTIYCFADGADTSDTSSASLSVDFSSDTAATFTVVKMSVTSGTLTKGADYSYEYYAQKNLYGSYWGNLTVSGTSYPMCIVIEESSVTLHSNIMGQAYSVVTFTNNYDGTLLAQCYNDGEDTASDSTHVTVTFDITAAPVECVPCIVPMKALATFDSCPKGSDYNNEYTY